MSNPKISVLINCYNGEEFLAEAIESVLNQTYGRWEIVFWDNQSTDSSADLVHSYRDKRIKYYRAPKHTNLAEARRLASRKLDGQWFGFLDCDDLWLPHKLEQQVSVLTESNVSDLGFVYGRTKLLCSNGHTPDRPLSFQRYRDRQPEGDIFALLTRCNFISLPSLLVNKVAFDKVGGFAGKYPICEDYFLSLRISKSYRVRAISEPVCAYRYHGKNASIASTSDGDFENLAILRYFYPQSAALKATLRVIARHFLKSYRSNELPSVLRIIRTLVTAP